MLRLIATRWNRFMGIGLLGLLFQQASGAPPLPGLSQIEVLKNIQTASQSVRSLECRFTERIRRPHLPEERVRGRLRYLRPGQLRIDQQVPDKQIIVSKDQTLRLYVPSAGQMLTGERAHWLTQNGFPDPLLSFVSDFPVERWDERYTIRFGGRDNGMYRLDFHPKQPGDRLLELWVSDKTFLPQRGRLPSDDVVIDIEFRDVIVNAPIPEAIFTLTIPENTVIVPMPS